MTDQDIVDCLARHGIGWGDEQGVTPYPLDGEDAPIYIAAIRELIAVAASVAEPVYCGCGDEITADDGARCSACVSMKYTPAATPVAPRAIAELVVKDGEGKINIAAFDIAPGTYPLYLGSPVAG